MPGWNEEDLIAFCEKLISRKQYLVAEEFLWEMNKRNRANATIIALLGRIFEETRQFELALKQYEAALLLSPSDVRLKERRDACHGLFDDPATRQGPGQYRMGLHMLRQGDDLHNIKYFRDTHAQQLQALREQVWPETAALPLERWKLSEAEIDALTMGRQATFEYWTGYSADTLERGPGYPQIYTDSQIDDFLAKVAKGEEHCYRTIDGWLYDAIAEFPIAGMNGAVIGSLSPWYESICLHYGARPTVVDYTTIICKTDRIKYLPVADFYELENAFDFAISISSIEHDGLGAYETPLSPDADILAMQKLSRAVKPGGLAFFNVPVGLDGVEYPLKRTYGRIRFPKLIEGWEIVKSWGFHEKNYSIPHPGEPFFVLRNAK